MDAAEEWEDEEVGEDVDDAAGEHDDTEALGGRKIREHENGEPGGNDDVGVDDAAPLELTKSPREVLTVLRLGIAVREPSAPAGVEGPRA